MPRFEELDRNGDGVISRQEYQSGIAAAQSRSSLPAGGSDYSPSSRGSPGGGGTRGGATVGSPSRGYGGRGEIGSLAASLAELTAANQGALNGMNQQMKLMQRQRGRSGS